MMTDPDRDELISRLWALEQRLARLEDRVASGALGPAAKSSPAWPAVTEVAATAPATPETSGAAAASAAAAAGAAAAGAEASAAPSAPPAADDMLSILRRMREKRPEAGAAAFQTQGEFAAATDRATQEKSGASSESAASESAPSASSTGSTPSTASTAAPPSAAPTAAPKERSPLVAALLAAREREKAEAVTAAAASKAATPKTAAAARTPAAPAVSWEVALATTWLPRIGGVLLLIGAAIGATLIGPRLGPRERVALGYLVAAAIWAGGWFVRRRSEVAAHATMAVGAALAYFVSFAAHFLRPMQVVGAPVSIALMVVFAAAIIVMAERWRSESIAIMGISLGVLAALISSGESKTFALVAIGILSACAGVLLVRHEWRRLTVIALALAYLATVILWILHPVGSDRGEILAHVGALFAYHLIFTVAFWRWSRVWMAREAAAETAPETDAAPALEVDVSLLPYSTGTAILNSVALSGLSLRLLFETKTLWPHVHILLFVLAGVEIARLAIPALRRGVLWNFHLVSAFGLGSAGLVAAYSGMTESAVMAAEALVLSIAASRARALRLLRPLTVICAGYAIRSFSVSPATLIGAFAVPAAMLPGVLLLASALPWELIWVRRPARFAKGGLGFLDDLSGQGRALIAAGMILNVLYDLYPDAVSRALSVEVLAIALSFALLALRAKAFLLATFFIHFTAIRYASRALLADDAGGLLVYPFLGLFVYVWHETAPRLRGRLLRVAALVLWPLLLLLLRGLVDMHLSAFVPLVGVWFAVVAAGAWAIAYAADRLGRMPSLVRPPPEEAEGDDAPGVDRPAGEGDVAAAERLRADDRAWRWARPGHIVALVMGAVAVGYAIRLDARVSLVSPAILSGVALAAWMWWARRTGRRTLAEGGAVALLLVIASAAPVVFSQGLLWSAAVAMAAGVGLFGAALWLRNPAGATVAGIQLCLVPVLIEWERRRPAYDAAAESLWGLGLAVALLGTTRLFALAGERMGGALGPFGRDLVKERGGRGWLTVAGAFFALSFLAEGTLLTRTFITVAWAGVGIAMLACGFIFLDAAMRYVSLAVFAAAIGRILFHDLADAELLTRTIAFLGVGVLLVGSGLAYAALRSRVERTPPAPDAPGDDPPSNEEPRQ